MRIRAHSMILVASLSVCALSSQAQHWVPADAAAVQEFVNRNDRLYAALPNMRMTTEILSYRNAGDAVPNDKGSSTVWRTGDRYKAEHLGMTTYQDKQISILIDPQERTIMLSAPTDMITATQVAMRDTFLIHAVRIGRASMGDGTHFRLKFAPGSLYDAVELVFDPQGWLRCETLYWGRPVLMDPVDPASEVIYPKVVLNLDVPVRIDPKTVNSDPASVIAWRDGEPVALGSWKDYDVFDTRPK